YKSNSKTAWSGTLVFGLQLELVNKAHEAKNRELKSIEHCNNYPKKDHVNIKAIDYLVNNYNFHIDFDKAKILQEGYQNIAAVNPTISCKYAVFNECILLTKQIKANIKIIQVNLEFLEVEIDSTKVENVDSKEITNMARISTQHSVKDLLDYIIPYL
ncbi:33097_t:CDS:2, partial [Gigaspora margarita]